MGYGFIIEIAMMKPAKKEGKPMNREQYTKYNAEQWDQWVEDGIEWGIPISHEDYLAAKNGTWDVYLTPMRPVPHSWFPALKGAQLLGLASGGAQQMPVFAALGANCTVFDYSKKQLESERMVAEREGYSIQIVRGDMTKPLPFPDGQFDVIFHPVSNCYIEDVYQVWRECYRILKPGGILLAGMDNGIPYLFNDDQTLVVENALPFNPLKNPEQFEKLMRDGDGMQFSHSLEEQIGGQLKAGLRLTDLFDDRDRPGQGRLRDFTPTYIATRAIKPEKEGM